MNRSIRHGMRGVSLIELMVALLIGTILVLGLVEVFAASRTAYQLSTGLARVQENGRFALDFLRRDLRMAGHMGCVNDQARFLPESVTASRPALVSTFLTDGQQQAGNYAGLAASRAALRFDLGIQGYDAKIDGTGGATQSAAAVTLVATPVSAGAANEWSPALPAQLFSDLAGGAGAVGDPVRNSDIVVLRFFNPEGAQVTSFGPGAPATIRFPPAQAPRLTEGVGAAPGLFGISDCMTAAVFEAQTFNAATGLVEMNNTGADLNESGFLGQNNFVTGQAMLYRAESIVYYIGLNASGNPSLYRLRYSLAPGTSALVANREEMVEGIESLQLQFGLDSRMTAAARPTGNIGSSMIAAGVAAQADPVTAWRRVGLVQVGLLARSPESAAAAQRDAAAAPLAPLGVRMTPPNDMRYRFVYEDSIAMRNRLFGN